MTYHNPNASGTASSLETICRAHQRSPLRLALADGKRLASASNDQTVKLWNPQTRQELLTLRDHTNEVWGVAFAPDGRTMLTGSRDKTLRL